MLKLAGAAAIGAAGTAALQAVPVSAADGGNMILGHYNYAKSTTAIGLYNQSSTASPLLLIDGYYSTASSATGISSFAHGGGTGVFGSTYSGKGLYGYSTTGTAIYGVGSRGVYGYGSGGSGGTFMNAGGGLFNPAAVIAASGSSADVKAAGTGRISQVQASGVGAAAPTWQAAYNYYSYVSYHEIVRGSKGEVWASRAYGAGTGQANWKRINTLRLDTSDGTGALFAPTRLVDSRAGGGPGGAVAGGQKGPFTGGTTKTWDLVTLSAGKIPSTAVGVTGNVTAVGWSGLRGYSVTLFPAGTTTPGVSTLNFGGTVSSWANAFICALSPTGLSVYFGFGSTGKTDIIIDITGYIE